MSQPPRLSRLLLLGFRILKKTKKKKNLCFVSFQSDMRLPAMLCCHQVGGLSTPQHRQSACFGWGQRERQPGTDGSVALQPARAAQGAQREFLFFLNYYPQPKMRGGMWKCHTMWFPSPRVLIHPRKELVRAIIKPSVGALCSFDEGPSR